MKSWILFPAILAYVAGQQPSATRLRVEYLDSPLTIDVATPRFTWALVHPTRGQYQTAYSIVVNTVSSNGNLGPAVWNTGKVLSNVSLNVPYGGTALTSDTDYQWTITWYDSNNVASVPAVGTFSTALYNAPDWQGAVFVSDNGTTIGNTYRSSAITLPSNPLRARMYIAGLGYYKAWINGVIVNDHELGQFVTFQQRTLYDVIDVTTLLRSGCNQLGVQLGSGWFNQHTVHAGPRQLRVLLSITNGDGSRVYYASSVTPSLSSSVSTASTVPLTFLITQGPVLQDDIYIGEIYDGRIEQALTGWSNCGYQPGNNVTWVPALLPSESPLTFNAIISTNAVPIRTDRTYSVEAGGITQPLPGVFVYDFGQNMAGQTELYVEDCPVGTNITLLHAEILYPDGTVHNNYLPGAPMRSIYYCSGIAQEGHRTYFSYYGFRYVQIEGFPGVPGENTVTAHFIHSDLPQSGEFSSSIPLLNQVQHATRYASLSNIQNIPTDCPQRERRGWLGDAQLSFNTVIHNFDGGAFYTKWLKDFTDSQVYNNLTLGTNGSLADCIPFYGHGEAISDSGWGAAGWVIPDLFSDMYADDVFDKYWYPNLKWYMEFWVASANNNGGLLPIFHWGDWANYYPGPYAFKTPEYPQVWYILALDTTAKFANRLGFTADAERYTTLAQQARSVYLTRFYNASNGCFADCTYVSQIFAISSNLVPQGSAEELQIWNQAMKWFNGTYNSEYTDLFGGGIISLKLLYSMIDRFNQTGLGLKFQIQNEIPSFGFWIQTGGATTLWEQWNMDSINGNDSRNHISK